MSNAAPSNWIPCKSKQMRQVFSYCHVLKTCSWIKIFVFPSILWQKKTIKLEHLFQKQGGKKKTVPHGMMPVKTHSLYLFCKADGSICSLQTLYTPRDGRISSKYTSIKDITSSLKLTLPCSRQCWKTPNPPVNAGSGAAGWDQGCCQKFWAFVQVLMLLMHQDVSAKIKQCVCFKK